MKNLITLLMATLLSASVQAEVSKNDLCTMYSMIFYRTLTERLDGVTLTEVMNRTDEPMLPQLRSILFLAYEIPIEGFTDVDVKALSDNVYMQCYKKLLKERGEQ